MQDRVFNNPKIDIRWNSEVDDVVGAQSGHGKTNFCAMAAHAAPALHAPAPVLTSVAAPAPAAEPVKREKKAAPKDVESILDDWADQ